VTSNFVIHVILVFPFPLLLTDKNPDGPIKYLMLIRTFRLFTGLQLFTISKLMYYVKAYYDGKIQRIINTDAALGTNVGDNYYEDNNYITRRLLCNHFLSLI
jgi:hypothetical protein